MVRAIPKKLLIHTIQYEELIGDGSWDKEYAPAITIENVRVSPASSLIRGANSESENINHTVFVDRTHSEPFPNFKKGSKITWNEETYELTAPNPHYDFKDKPHHYELGLS